MKKPTIKSLKAKLWALCRDITRKRYPPKCYICDLRGLSGSGLHTCHLIPSGACGAFLRYDLRNLRPCCYRCNIHLGGNAAEFYRRMVEEVGQKAVDILFKDKQKIVKADVIWYQNLITGYENILTPI